MAQAVSAILFLDNKGKPVLCRDYRSVANHGVFKDHITDLMHCRGDIPLKVSENFIARLNELEDANKASPVIFDENITFTYIQYSNLYLLALSRTNSNAAAVVAFLHKIVDIFKHYFREVR